VTQAAFLRREAQAQETTATQVQMPLSELARTRVENIKGQLFDFGPP
jgi:chaperone required for assembly of F1-ATPase